MKVKGNPKGGGAGKVFIAKGKIDEERIENRARKS